jgi:hypothetical protein
MGVGGQRHTLATLPAGKTWYPLCRRLGGPQGRSGWVQKISPHQDSIPRPSLTTVVRELEQYFLNLGGQKGCAVQFVY